MGWRVQLVIWLEVVLGGRVSSSYGSFFRDDFKDSFASIVLVSYLEEEGYYFSFIVILCFPFFFSRCFRFFPFMNDFLETVKQTRQMSRPNAAFIYIFILLYILIAMIKLIYNIINKEILLVKLRIYSTLYLYLYIYLYSVRF